ncbi:hypothetical protein NDU88_007362 [Pleurodeles waltl]|uniref:Uncharacterized protein n=1 Tax=Pleurodeles waltl TaxID=8319 RepID=A0AAV7PL15_PLEWA|nr:hypothetical protein NDU88_007362 [Pleurodeles waltl]
MKVTLRRREGSEPSGGRKSVLHVRPRFFNNLRCLRAPGNEATARPEEQTRRLEEAHPLGVSRSLTAGLASRAAVVFHSHTASLTLPQSIM